MIPDIHVLEIERYKQRLHTALKAAKICVFEVDLVRQLYTFFENSEDIFGVAGEKILGDVQPFSRLNSDVYLQAVSDYFSHPDDQAVIRKAFQSIFDGEPASYQARMKAGETKFIWCKIDVTPILEDGVPVKMIGVIMDISDMKMRTDQLEKKAELDGFTGLYNKTGAEKMIIRILNENSGKRHALILMDIDRFKGFNDAYGHSKGDKVLQFVAKKLKESFRETDVIGRFGGDEFIVLIKDITSLEWLIQRLEGLIHCDMDGLELTNSLGVSFFPDNGRDFHQLFEKADEALYQSKRQRETYTFCQSSLDHSR